jgi:hypothetical protein
LLFDLGAGPCGYRDQPSKANVELSLGLLPVEGLRPVVYPLQQFRCESVDQAGRRAAGQEVAYRLSTDDNQRRGIRIVSSGIRMTVSR